MIVLANNYSDDDNQNWFKISIEFISGCPLDNFT
jgi:hypothetical protein